MVDEGTPLCEVEERSGLNPFSASVNDSINHTRDGTGTANSETADEQTQES